MLEFVFFFFSSFEFCVLCFCFVLFLDTFHVSFWFVYCFLLLLVLRAQWKRRQQEAFVKHVVAHVMEKCGPDLAFFNQFYDKELLQRLQIIKDKPFVRVGCSLENGHVG